MPNPNSPSIRRFPGFVGFMNRLYRNNSTLKIRSSLLVFSVILVPFLGCKAAPETPEQQVDRLLDVTGMRREIHQLPDFIQEEVSGAPDSLMAARQARLAQLLLDTYQPEQILTAVRTSLTADYQKEHANALLRSMSLPLAVRIRTSEQAADEEKGDEVKDAFALKMEQGPPPEARTTLVTSYAQATGKLDIAIEMIVSVMLTYYTVTSTNAEKDSVDADVLEVMMATMETDINQGVSEMFIANELFAFRDPS